MPRTRAAGIGHLHYTRVIGQERSTGEWFSSAAQVANRLYAIPIQVFRRFAVSKLGWVISVQAGNIRTGIYRDNGDTPVGGALLIDNGGVACGLGNRKQEVDCVLILEPGLYWLAMVCDAAPTLIASQGIGVLGGTLLKGRVAFAYAALPNPFPAGFVADLDTPYQYLIGLNV